MARLNPRKVSTRKVPVVFDPRVAGSLVGHLASAINGSAIARKTSFLKDKLGEQLFAPASTSSTIRCAGAACARARSTPRASPAARLALVDDGVLTTWLLDCATARELGLATTGHAQRGASSTPSPGPTNLHLEPGTLSPDELIADIDEGFYVTDLIGTGVNLVTGDYSRGAAGFWIENGERTYPVSEVTIAGHLLDMFRTLTPANDLEVPLRHQCADRAGGGADRCRRLSLPSERLRDRERACGGGAGGRRDRAELLSRAAARAGPRARAIRRSPRPTSRPTICCIGVWCRPATAGCRRKARTIRRGSPRAASGWSIRSTARAPLSPAARTGRSRPRWSRTAGRSPRRSLRR